MITKIKAHPVRFILLVTSVLLIIALIVDVSGFSYFYNPKRAFQRIFHFELPVSSQVIHSDYSMVRDVSHMKIQINKDEIENVESGLLQYYGSSLTISDYSWIPPCHNIHWWDLNEKDIVVAYVQDESGKIVKTKSTYAIVTKNNDQFFLYVIRS